MKHLSLLPLLALSPLCAQETAPATPAAVTAPTEAQTTIQAHFDASTVELRALHRLLSGIKTAEEAQALHSELAAVVARYDACMNAIPEDTVPTDEMLKDWRAAHRELRKLCEREDFVALVWVSEPLMHVLLIQSPNLPCYLDEQAADYMMMTATNMTNDEESPRMLEACAKLRAAAAERHRAFMQEHADTYGGGDGHDEASAIILRPFAEHTAGTDDEDADSAQKDLVFDYITAVYPEFSCGYSSRLATPEGGLYIVMSQFPGLYTREDGELRIINYKLYFCTKAPSKQ